MKKPLIFLLLVAMIAAPAGAPRAAPALSRPIYSDSLAPGWQNWSWATVNLGATSPVHSGSKSISVSMGAWQGLYLHNPSPDLLGTTHLQFYIHGGSAGGQRLNLLFYFEAGNGPALALPLPQAGAWTQVRLPLTALNPAGARVSGIVWQDASGGSQPVFYIDDIAFVSEEDPNGPQLSEGVLLPRSLPADGFSTLAASARVSDPQGAGDIAEVRLVTGSLGLGEVVMADDGRSYDGAAGDGVYGAVLMLPPGAPSGERFLLVTARDGAGHTASLPLGALNVLAPPGGGIPAGLPQRIGWGSNAWSETPGGDWQVNSGVPWDYVYQYITYDWESWGGSFVRRFVNQAWNKGFTPMVVVYMALKTPPDCGEDSLCYAGKLKNPAFVNAYLASLERVAVEARGDKPVIFNLEPDFYGYMQQLSRSSSRPPGVQPDDPASYPVALNRPGYPNNLAGFGRYIVDLIHLTASNALVAPMASAWAAPPDPQNLSAAAAIENAGRVAAFIGAMGGAQADLLVVEWSDRDAGSGQRPWWDDADQVLPRPTRAILWENALARASGKRLLLWQVPVGNMALDDTCDHYRDNRAAYLFNHARDIFEAGIAGVLFGGGMNCMTQVSTDGGFVKAQGQIAYAAPAAPIGLAVESVSGPLARLRWNASPEPDLWRYALRYRRLPNGAVTTIPVSRRNSTGLILPEAGDWEVRLAAVDAMGNTSAFSAPVSLTTLEGARLLYLPALGRR